MIKLVEMKFQESTTLAVQSPFSSDKFWFAVNIYIRSPQSVSRRLCGTVPVFDGVLRETIALHHDELIKRILSANLTNEYNRTKTIEDSLKSVGLNIWTPTEQEQSDCISLSIKKWLPRNSEKYRPCLELIIRDESRCIATFSKLNPNDNEERPFVATLCPFSIQLVGEELQLVAHSSDMEDKGVVWLKTHLFPKLVKWASSEIVPHLNTVGSNNLISIDSYNDLYQQLKLKYGKKMVEIWPEVTDPAKYVYEDIAIATYLLLLWKKEREEADLPPDKKQSFIDLGCGNGLLVFILSSEGHSGMGLDVRKRGIWDQYPETTQLKVRSINPSDDCTFPEYDWLIGNHSDELTPWIPVWASQSSYKCNFFLLPCCFFDFGGNRYQRHDASHSQYSEYLNYIHHISTLCGFVTEIDRLKIPSTKRICLIGNKRTYPPEELSYVHQSVNSWIKSRSDVSNVQLRAPKEVVRNCTQIERSIIDKVLKIVIDALLNETASCGAKWNPGGIKTLGKLAEMIPKETLQELKHECGGLQTLLKNHRFIFQVIQGTVKLREPTVEPKNLVNETCSNRQRGKRNRPKSKESILKRKSCWFYKHHPDGCPLSAVDCSHLHE